MADWLTVVHTLITVVGVIVLIVGVKLDPLFALVIGTVYLGLATGQGAEGTVEIITTGFGSIMAEIGLLIVLGVLLGAILFRLGAIDGLVEVLMKVSGRRFAPYALGATTGTVLQSIFSDVIFVITAPVGRSVARRLGKAGIGIVSASLSAGILFGLTMMIPSVGSLALSSLVGVPIPRFLLFGTAVAVVGIVLTILVMKLLFLRFGMWDTATDEDHTADALDEPAPDDEGVRRLPLWLTITPVFLALVLIAAESVLTNIGVDIPVMSFLGSPTVAMFLATFLACVLLRISRDQDCVKQSMKSGFTASGEILALTGLGGSLAEMVKSIGLGDILGGMFSEDAASPILLAWVLAVVLHIAIGSVSVASITAAGFLAPVAASTGVDPVLIALSAAAGSLFFMTVHSNFFWMTKTMLGQTTKGAVKSVSITTSVGSLIGLGLVFVLSWFL